MLYIFSRIKFNPNDPTHFTEIQKHFVVLQVILANSMRGKTDDSVGLIVMELQKLVDKYAGRFYWRREMGWRAALSAAFLFFLALRAGLA